MTITVLMVAEKPSIAETLAHALCKGKPNTRQGTSPASKVHEYEGDFYGQRAWFKVTSTVGHVYSTDFPREYNNWDQTDPGSLFDAPIEKIEANTKVRMPRHFQVEGKGCHHLVLWLDCDREGENICFEVIENVKPVMNKLQGQDQIWRAQFSSLAPQDLVRSFQNLGFPNKDMSDSVEARQELDLKIGCAFTRFQTKYFQGRYGDLDASLVSYGPCQTPTLWFCVMRHDEIEAFQPETFYVVDVQVDKKGQLLDLTWMRGQVFDLPVATIFKDIVMPAGSKPVATVVDVTMKEDRVARPQALNTVAMLKMASQRLGMGPMQAMHVAESLYLKGFLTYPRTETNTYPKNFDLKATVAAQQNSPLWGNIAKELVGYGLNKARDGIDMGDHPPITPVRGASEDQVGGHDAWRLYEMVTRHFLATVMGDCKFMKTKVKMNINGEMFFVSGRKTVDPGFTRVAKSGEMQDVEIGNFDKGEKLPVRACSISNHKTRPPGYLSESDLLALMEKNGIGTDASMATHINNICERNYVALTEPGRRLIPTKLGICLIHGYQLIDPELVIPKVRANIENNCTLVAQGKANMENVVRHCLHNFQKKFEYVRAEIQKMDMLFQSSFSPLTASGKAFVKCGVTQRYLSLVNSKPCRLYNPKTEEIYQLPQGGEYKVYSEKKCPVCSFELIMYVCGERAYPLCPQCYNSPPTGVKRKDGGGRAGAVCLECPHAENHPLIDKVHIGACPESFEQGGVLMIDPRSLPGQWKLVSTRAQLVIQFAKHVHKIKLLDDLDDEGYRMLQVDFHKDKSPLDDGTQYIGSLFDEIVEGCIESKNVSKGRRKGGGKGGKGKGKGKGKKGGKHKKNADDEAEERGRKLAAQGKKR